MIKLKTIKNDTDLLYQFGKAWNKLDTKYLEYILCDDFIYESQWVFTPIKGKDAYLKYLNAKFESIKKDLSATPIAELALFDRGGNNDLPCLVITQKDFKACIIIQSENHKIKRADMTFAPNPNDAILSGITPN